MDNESPAERARMYAEGARRNFKEQGNVAPMITLCCEAKAVTVMAAGNTDDQPTQFGGIALVLAGRFQPHTIVTVCEVWAQRAAPDTDIDSIKRGDLGRAAAAGDTSVNTALMTTAWRLVEEECHNIIDYVGVEPEFDRYEIDGMQFGHMADMVLSGWRTAIANSAPPPVITDERLLALLSVTELATAVSIQEW